MSEEARNAPAGRGKKAHPGIVAVAMTVVLLCAAAIILNASVLKISSVKVVGNVARSAEYVAELSGVIGQGFLSLSDGAVREKIDADHYCV